MYAVNITMVTCGRLSHTRHCLESLLPVLGPDTALTVVDNGSKDGTTDYLQRLLAGRPGTRLLFLKRNMGVAVAANLGWASQDAAYYVKLDNDMEIVRPDWLETLVAIAEAAPEVGLVGHKVCDWHACERLTLSSGAPFLRSVCCNGACILIPRRTHQRCGFWTEDYGRYGHTDLDYSRRAALAGMLVGYADVEGAVLHLGYERDVDETLETLKLTARSAEAGGEKTYLLNQLLFEEGVRDLCVQRKYRPVFSETGISFTLDEAYRPIMRLHQELLEKVKYEAADDGTVRLRLAAFKNEA